MQFTSDEGATHRICVESGDGVKVLLKFADGCEVAFPLEVGAIATIKVGKQPFDIELRDLESEPAEAKKKPQLRLIEGGLLSVSSESEE